MPQVFTVYNCGTNYNRDRTDETIANLAARTLGAENRDWMINDGPGSTPGSKPTLAQAPGLRDPVTGMRNDVSKLKAREAGIVDGFGWDENVAHSVAVIKAILAGSSNPPGVINMAGWSRGAITCHMLAHALLKDAVTARLIVNIFAFDPVPGPGNFSLDKVSLPSNVQNYSAILMEDEGRKIMKPVVFDASIDENSSKKFKMYPLPGAHETSVSRSRTEVGTIAAGLAHKFLTRYGTRLKDPMLLTDVQYCELYAKVRLDIAKFRAMKGPTSQRLLLGSLDRNVPNTFRDTGYFINNHHAHKFAKVFPGMWRLMNCGAQNQVDVQREAMLVRAKGPTTYESLVAEGII
jgi:hypothetical protein